jgi:membrane fusion protein (multidrug efflux system)
VVAEVGGRLDAVFAREGERVAAGAPLASLDARDLTLAVAEAQAALAQAQAQLREATLLDDEIADAGLRARRLAFARVRSGVEAAEVRLRRAELERSRSRITAPYPGVVASLRHGPGDWVRPGDVLLTLLDLERVRVSVPVLETELGLVRPGGRARVLFAGRERWMPARISRVDPAVEPSSRSARVTLQVETGVEAGVVPGMSARARLETRRLPGRVLVPREAVLEREGRALVFVAAGAPGAARACWRYVRVGMGNDSLVEILPGGGGGLEPGEVVLVEGHSTLAQGAAIRLQRDQDRFLRAPPSGDAAPLNRGRADPPTRADCR